MTLRLAPDGSEVRVTLPRWAPDHDAVQFARSRAAWLEAQLACVPLAIPLLPGAEIGFRGDTLRLDWREGTVRKPLLVDGALTIGGPRDGFASRAQRWLESQAERLLAADLADYCAAAGLPVPRLRLSRAQRRWGSCATDGTVRINWRLVMAPDPVRRSVVAHEVAHLVHFDHSRAFHALLGALFEGDIGNANAWLKAHGRGLYAAFG